MIGTSFFIHQLVRCSLQKVENHYPDGLPEKIVLNSNDQFLWVGWVLNQAECCSKAASHWANLQLTNSFENMSSKWKYSPWALRLQETLEISKREKGMLEKTKENTRFFSLMWILFGFDLGSKQYSLLGSRCSEGTGNCKFSLGWGGSLAKSKQTKRLHESLPLWREGKSLPPSSSDIKGARPPTPTHGVLPRGGSRTPCNVWAGSIHTRTGLDNPRERVAVLHPEAASTKHEGLFLGSLFISKLNSNGNPTSFKLLLKKNPITNKSIYLGFHQVYVKTSWISVWFFHWAVSCITLCLCWLPSEDCWESSRSGDRDNTSGEFRRET